MGAVANPRFHFLTKITTITSITTTNITTTTITTTITATITKNELWQGPGWGEVRMGQLPMASFTFQQK